MTSLEHAEAQAAVDTVFGAGRAQVVDVQTRTVVREQEVVLINGRRVQLSGRDGEALRHAFATGTVPSAELVGRLLQKGAATAAVAAAPADSGGGEDDSGGDGCVKPASLHLSRFPSSSRGSSPLPPQSPANICGTNSVSDSSTTTFTADDDGGASTRRVATSLRVDSRLTTRDTMFVRQNGSLVDERSKETRRDCLHTASTVDLVTANRPMATTSGPISPTRRLMSTADSSVCVQTASLSPGNDSGSECRGAVNLGAGVERLALAPDRANNTSTRPMHRQTSTPARAANVNDSGYVNSGESEAGSTTSKHGSLTCVAHGDGPATIDKPSIFGTVTDNECVDQITGPSASTIDETGEKFSHDESQQATSRVYRLSDHSSSTSTNHQEDTASESMNSCQRGSSPASQSATNRQPLSTTVVKKLQFRDACVTSASLESLIEHLTPTASHYPDRAFIFAFLLSARLYIRPHDLIKRVAMPVAPEIVSSRSNPLSTARTAERLVQLLSEWCDAFPYDFRDQSAMSQLHSIAENCINANPDLQQEVGVVLKSLLEKLTCLERYERRVQMFSVQAEKLLHGVNCGNNDVMQVCSSPEALCEQLTVVELERLSFIGSEEFVQAFAKESAHIDVECKNLKTTKNLEYYVLWFNRLSYMVATGICTHARKRQRVRLIDFWCRVAHHCLNMGNFNSLMAIIAGLNLSPVARLKKTWARLDMRQLNALEQQMSPSSNFLNYRTILQAAMWRSDTVLLSKTPHQHRVIIPFFSLLVKDLYFLNEGCANRLPDGHVNLDKFWQLARQVTEFITWKQVRCPFEERADVVEFLLTSAVHDEHALWLASYDCEPPENSFEKERLKILKARLKP